MGAWVTQVGFPVVTVAKSEGGEGLGGILESLLLAYQWILGSFGGFFGAFGGAGLDRVFVNPGMLSADGRMGDSGRIPGRHCREKRGRRGVGWRF
jgi:hypothetical protein